MTVAEDALARVIAVELITVGTVATSTPWPAARRLRPRRAWCRLSLVLVATVGEFIGVVRFGD